jgi:ABC-2 type transport system permease protein
MDIVRKYDERRVSIGLIQAAIFLIVGYLGFEVTERNWAIFAGAILSGTLVFVTTGYVLAGTARSTESAMGVAQVALFPMMMLSGSLIDIERLPTVFRPVAKVIPLTYLEDLRRQLMAGAPAQHTLALNFAVLGGSFVVMPLLAIRLWKWE